MSIKDEKGLALPLVMMVMFVTALLGTALWQYSMADTIQVSRSQRQIEAYYVARSGADAIAGYIIKNPAEASTMIDKTVSSSASGSVGNGEFLVNVTGNPFGNINIESTGIVGDAQRSVKLLMPRLTGSAIFLRALHQTSDAHLDLTGMNVVGDVEAAGTITTKPGYTYTAYENSTAYYPPAIFPNYLDPGTPFTFDTSPSVPVHVTSNYKYGFIKSLGGDVNIISTGKILVDWIEIKADIIIAPSERLELYITDTINQSTLQTPQTYNLLPEQLIIYLADGVELEIIGNGEFNGYIYGPGATVTVQSNSTTINGAVIAETIQKNSSNGPNGNVNHIGLPGDFDILDSIHAYKRGYWSN